ncbi:MAG: ADP-ribosylglycohydrolase family protein, partial [Marinilabiliaceae bacterium]|nr:ADP-ribosylglycohydrolase family protein [Marinilabiliaceae bacterium]
MKHCLRLSLFVGSILFTVSCSNSSKSPSIINPEFNYVEYKPASTDVVISRTQYLDQLEGFWLGQCIANWTG